MSVGIHALEVCLPSLYCTAEALEQYHGVDGKYTRGLLMESFSCPAPNEDVVSMCLSSLDRLLILTRIDPTDVGMLIVASESFIDASVSIQSVLARYMCDKGCVNLLGSDVYHACYGCTGALLACADWIQSPLCDKPYAIVVCSDIADMTENYKFMVGGASVALLVGRNAPLELRNRYSYTNNSWDFYKPVGSLSMAPIVDGTESVEVYKHCLLECLEQAQRDNTHLATCDRVILHFGSSVKFVKHASDYLCNLIHEDAESFFDAKIAPSLKIARCVGPHHTASVFVSILSLLLDGGKDLIGSSIAVFSYGSGASATLFMLQVHDLPAFSPDVIDRDLNARAEVSAKAFEEACANFSNTYGATDFKPDSPVLDSQHCVLVECKGGRRAYELCNAPSCSTQAGVVS